LPDEEEEDVKTNRDLELENIQVFDDCRISSRQIKEWIE
jgi:hypothetical protein